VGWLVAALAGLLVTPGFVSGLGGFNVGVSGSESQQAETLVQRHFANSFSEQDLIVFQSTATTAQDPAYQAVITQALRNVASVPGVVGVISPLDPQVTDQISADGHAALALVGVRGSTSALQSLAPVLTSAAQRASTADVRVLVTGESEIWADMNVVETQDVDAAERIGLPLALLVLLLAFGSLVAASVPLLLAMVGVAVAFGGMWALGHVTSFGLLIETIMPMIGLGVGIDYAMFITTRYREELARGLPPVEAVAVTMGTTGKAIFFSGLTVVLALSALLLVQFGFAYDMAIGAMVAVGATVLVALTLLPAVLGALGPRVNRLALPFLRRGLAQPNPDAGVWARWSRVVMRRAALWAPLAILLLLVVASPLTNLTLGLDMGTSDLSSRPSGQAVAVLQREFSPGALSPIQIVVRDPRGALTDADLNAIAQLTSALQRNPQVAQVVSLTSALDQATGTHSAAALDAVEAMPQAQTLLSYVVNFREGNDTTILRVVSRSPTDANAALQLVRSIRGTLAPQIRNASGLTIAVGGLSAQIVDLSSEFTSKFPLVVGIVLLLAFLLLTLVFRSLVLPLKAIVMNLLSVGAAFGLLVVVFQQGAGAQVFNFTPVGNIQVYLPLLAYALLFGLSMDYEVFMVGRMREEWVRTGDNEVAVARGLQHSGRAITSAAAIMVTIFLSFTISRMLEMKEIGFALAAAIFVDATVIRVLLVPAAMRLMGHWNWWLPRWLDRLLPKIALGEGVNTPGLPVALSAVEIQSPGETDTQRVTSGV
jgi:RND superfamily putative drug exporter